MTRGSCSASLKGKPERAQLLCSVRRNSGYLLCEVTAGLKAGWGSIGGSGRSLMSGVDFEGFNRGRRGGGLTAGTGGVTGE